MAPGIRKALSVNRLNSQPRRAGVHRFSGIFGATIAVYIVSRLLPGGLPLGVVLLGTVIGSLYSLTALGLILVYRAARVINFSQAAIGGLAAAVAVILALGRGVPFYLAMLVGLITAAGTGAVIERAFLRRLSLAPRLIVTVATIGIAQVLGAIAVVLPQTVEGLRPMADFTAPFSVRFVVGPIVFDGNHVTAIMVVPLVLVSLGWFLGRTNVGIAIRGAADSTERALLLGIPVKRLSLITWTVAATLSGLGTLMTTPILGANVGAIAGPTVLLAPLAAAILARLANMPVAVLASIGIGIVQQSVFWSYPQSSTVDVAVFAVVLLGLILQRQASTRESESGYGGYLAVAPVRPIPAVLMARVAVRRARTVLSAIGAGVALVLPACVSESRTTLLSYIAIYGVIAVSLVILTGWSGQISLGQFAFVGVGAGVTGSLLANARLDLFLALMIAGVVGGALALVIGLPALRIPGLFLAVATLAFAVPVSTFVLSSAHVPILAPEDVSRPLLLGRFSLDTPRTFYYLCLGVLVPAILAAHNFRRSRIGRVVVAVRDNERAAASFAMFPARSKLVAFAFAGALAAIAGGLYVVGLRGIAYSGFAPEQSLQVFSMVVIGGLGSLLGAVLGAIYVQGAQYLLPGAWQLLATGAGMLIIIELLPNGLASVVYRLRDNVLARYANHVGLSIPGLTEKAAILPDLTPQGTAATAHRVAAESREGDQGNGPRVGAGAMRRGGP